MAHVEQVLPRPDWLSALDVALTRPDGTPERRSEEDPWESAAEADRPRRISDDLAWLRQAIDEPGANGLTPREGTAAVALWELADDEEEEEVYGRLLRLAARGVLEAAGFLLHDDSTPE